MLQSLFIPHNGVIAVVVFKAAPGKFIGVLTQFTKTYLGRPVFGSVTFR